MEKAKKAKTPQRDVMGSTAKQRRAEMKEFNKRPGEAAKLKAIRAKNKEPGRVMRGPNKGLMRGTGKGY